jgi:hypothetical protein
MTACDMVGEGVAADFKEILRKGHELTLIVICLLAFAFYLVKYHSPFQTTVTDPNYVEICIDIHE